MSRTRAVMQIVISLALLTFGFYVLTGNYDDGVQEFAAGWVGAVVGFWLS
jgi:hypothetical protein